MPGVFDYSAVDSRLPIGAVVQSPLNLEKMTNGQWLRLDGRDCTRSDYPLVQAQFPAGVFTTTARTLAANPSDVSLDTDGTNFMAPAATGTDALQASADGITWVNTTGGWAASSRFPSRIVAGTRWIIAPSAGESQPYVINTGGTAANLVVKGNWTVTTSGSVTSLNQGLAYGSTANAGAGRTVLAVNGSLATASGLFYLNDGATAWSAASGGSTCDRTCVVWTGQKFIAFTAAANQGLYQTSSDGATWADNYFPIAYSANFAGASTAASDGAGTVVTSMRDGYSTSIFEYANYVSKDHGVTWQKIILNPNLVQLTNNGALRFQYINGKFIGTTSTGIIVSSDGLSWQFEPVNIGRGNIVGPNILHAVAYKSGVYMFVRSGTSGYGFSATENMSKFRLTDLVPALTATNATPVGPLDSISVFMRVK